MKLIKWFLSLFKRKQKPIEVSVELSGTYQIPVTTKQPVKMDKPRLQKKQKYSYVSRAIKNDYGFIASRRERKAMDSYYPMKRYYNY